jgi:hypothetical protein
MSLTESHDRLQGAGPSEVGQGRKPAARSASLDGLQTVRQRFAERSWLGVSSVSTSCARSLSSEVREAMILHRLAQDRRLWVKNAPHRKVLIFRHSSAVRPGRTSRLLSCHRSVGGRRRANPALSFAKSRSGDNQAKRPRNSFRADSLQLSCRLLGGQHARYVRPIDRS